MAAYDLEEQEKIDDLKAWWEQYGNTITVGIVLACIVIGSVQGWRWWAGRRAADASVLYQAVSDGVRKNDPAKVKDALRDTISLVDKMAAKKLIHRNTAGRYKSRLASRVAKKSAAA